MWYVVRTFPEGSGAAAHPAECAPACPPAHPHCWGSPVSAHPAAYGLAAHCICSHFPFFHFQGRGLGIWLCAFRFFSCHFKSTARSWCAVLTPSLLPPHPHVAVPASGSPIPVLSSVYIWCQTGFWQTLCGTVSSHCRQVASTSSLFCPCASPCHAPALPHPLFPCSPPANFLLRLAPIHTQESQTGWTGLLALANSFCIVSALSNISPIFTSVFFTEAADPFSLFKDDCGLGWALQASAQHRVIFVLI